jgi:glycosyltransferase involved in cell wall biosynthesis
MSRKLTILHFNVLEKYPPAINLISDVLIQKPDIKISVITSVNNSPYNNQSFSGVKILRLGSTSKNAILRYASYLIYNFIGTLVLLIKRPDVVIVYETLSVLPAYVFAGIFPKKKIHIHFHEYLSIPEKNGASKYIKFLFKCEDMLLQKCTSSQTNEDRRELFLKDNFKLKKQNVFVFPNMPPKSWWTELGHHKKPWEGGKIKLVYVGVLDSETMYLEEVLRFVNHHADELELTLFSQDVSLGARKLISKFQSVNICLKSALEYSTLPQELRKYDIGLVLYKGHIPNYVYNVPNKVFEYLYCGVKVLSDNCLLSLAKLNSTNIILTEFKDIQKYEISKLRDLLKTDFTKDGISEQFSTLIDQI